MRVPAGCALGLAMLVVGSATAAPVGDGGGRDVSVAIFSAFSLRAMTMTPLGPNSWVSACALCAHKPLTAPLHVAGPMEIYAGGSLRIADDASGETRTATGLWHLRSSGKDGAIDVVLTLPSERYVTAVLNAEAAPGEPAQSLQALAILARTYALNGSHFSAPPGHLPAELCDSTQCQAMLPGPVSRAIDDATQATAGETVWFGSHRAEAFFSQSCGGLTEDGGAVWPNLRGLSYLRSHADPYCVRRGTAAWHAEVPLMKLAEIARTEGWHLPTSIVAARIADRSPSHRALRIVFTGATGATAVVSASALRFGVGRALGWEHVRSDAYELGVRNRELVFDGRGHGHGVGLCQEGAAEMASEGQTAREILAFYFPRTAVHILPSDAGWQQTRIGPLTVRSTEQLSAERIAALQQTWSEAQRRFPSRHAAQAEIVFAPATELFRQISGQPGWALGSTRGSTIVLQPDSVLRAHGLDLSATLLHEMLHVLVEAEASERAPLWLREGLVEVLAGESVASAPAQSLKAIDDALLRPGSLRESEEAHRAAAARVRVSIGRYGLSVVRGWLSSGVPASVD